MIAPWPLMEEQSETGSKRGLPQAHLEVAQFGAFQQLIVAIRSARAEYNVNQARKIGAIVRVRNESLRDFLEIEADSCALLGRIDSSQLVFSSEFVPASNNAVRLVISEGLEVDLPLEALVDVAKEQARLSKQLIKLKKDVAGLEKRINSTGFLNNASPEIVAETKAQLDDKMKATSVIERSLNELNAQS